MRSEGHRPSTDRSTGRRKRIVALLLASLLGAVGSAAGDAREQPAGAVGEAPEAPVEASAADAATELTLGGGEVVLAYPPELRLVTEGEEPPARAALACAEPFDHCLHVPAEAHAGTNLSAAGLRISERGELTAETSCLLAQPGGWSELQPGVLRLPAASTARFGDLREGAAGSYSLGEVRRLWASGSCYEFEARLVLTRHENHEAGSVEEFGDKQQAALLQELLAVTESATLKDGTGVEWPLAPRSSLRAFVRLDRPGLGVRPTSPLQLSGSAVGPWFFEGSFPVELVTTDGRVLASHYVMADGDWMTEGFVPFGGVLEFEVTEPTEAVLVLRRDNPSDLPENDAAVRVSLTLMPPE